MAGRPFRELAKRFCFAANIRNLALFNVWLYLLETNSVLFTVDGHSTIEERRPFNH